MTGNGGLWTSGIYKFCLKHRLIFAQISYNFYTGNTMMKIAVILSGICTVALSLQGTSQTLSHDDLKIPVDLWRAGYRDSVQRILPTYERKYGAMPEIRFLRAAFDTDAQSAVTVYEALEKSQPGHGLADHVLYRLIQYHAALGRYQTAGIYLKTLQARFPRSEVLPSAEALFPDEMIPLASSDTASSVSKSEGKWALQLGAFSEKANADKWMQTLRNKGLHGLTVEEKISGGKKLFIVVYGSFSAREEAATAGESLKNRYQTHYSIIRK